MMGYGDGTFMAQLDGAVMAKWVIVFGRYAQKNTNILTTRKSPQYGPESPEKNLQHVQKCLPPNNRRSTKMRWQCVYDSQWVGSLINVVITNSTHWAPPPIWLVVHSSVNTNRKLVFSLKALGGEWSHPFCSSPLFRSSKGWPERVDQCLFEHISQKTIAHFAITAPPI